MNSRELAQTSGVGEKIIRLLTNGELIIIYSTAKTTDDHDELGQSPAVL